MTFTPIIVDTNVILAASGEHDNISDSCILNCAKYLQEIISSGHVVIDDNFKILGEYLKKTTPKNQSIGGKFLKWLLQNSSNIKFCTQISVQEHPERGFENFPSTDDHDIRDFDSSDRIFVAVSAAHPDKPPILQATDCKWINWELGLKRHGITINFVCEQDIKRFHKSAFPEKYG